MKAGAVVALSCVPMVHFVAIKANTPEAIECFDLSAGEMLRVEEEIQKKELAAGMVSRGASSHGARPESPEAAAGGVVDDGSLLEAQADAAQAMGATWHVHAVRACMRACMHVSSPPS